MEALVPEDYESDPLQLCGDSDHSEELPWKDVGEYEHSKTSKDEEEVIHAASDLVDF